MMTERVSCPYCNTGFNPGNPPDNGRMSCPRCGESFPVTAPAGSAANLSSSHYTGSAGSAGSELAPMSVNGSYPPEPPASNSGLGGLRSLVFLSCGLMIIVAIGFVYNLLPRTPTKPPTTQPIAVKPATTQPPTALAGLGYLPPESQLIVAIQPGSFSTYADRKETSLRELTAKLGLPAPVSAFLDKTQLPIEDVAALIVGVIVPDDNAIPQGMLVLSLRKPLPDPVAFRAALNAHRFTAPEGGTRDKIEINGFPLELQELDPKTFLIATDGRLLRAAAKRTRTGTSTFSAAIRSSITTLSPASFAWIVTDSLDWSKKPVVKLLAGLNRDPQLPERLAPMRAVAAGFSLEPELQLKLRLTTSTAEDAARIRKQYAEHTSSATGTDDQVEVEFPVDPAKGFDGLEWLFTEWVSPKKP